MVDIGLVGTCVPRHRAVSISVQTGPELYLVGCAGTVVSHVFFSLFTIRGRPDTPVPAFSICCIFSGRPVVLCDPAIGIPWNKGSRIIAALCQVGALATLPAAANDLSVGVIGAGSVGVPLTGHQMGRNPGALVTEVLFLEDPTEALAIFSADPRIDCSLCHHFDYLSFFIGKPSSAVFPYSTLVWIAIDCDCGCKRYY